MYRIRICGSYILVSKIVHISEVLTHEVPTAFWPETNHHDHNGHKLMRLAKLTVWTPGAQKRSSDQHVGRGGE